MAILAVPFSLALQPIPLAQNRGSDIQFRVEPPSGKKLKDPAVHGLLQIRVEMRRRFVQRRISLSDLRVAYLARDFGSIAAYFGYSEQELLGLERRLRHWRDDLLRRNPHLAGAVLQYNACSHCNVDAAIKMIDNEVELTGGCDQHGP